MHRLTIALCVSFVLASLPASGASIGIATAEGSFRVDSNLVIGNATLFEGNTLETGVASSDVEIAGDIRLRLGADSRGRVFRDRLVLEKGRGELGRGSAYWIEALGLHILAGGPESAGRVAIDGSRKVQAAALSGTLRVTAGDGTVVALLKPGMALEFEPQDVTGAQAPFQMTGCLERRAGHLVVRDPISGVVEEVRGERLEGEIGRMIEVTATIVPGVQPVEGALEVIRVTRVRRASGECVTPAETPAAAKPAAAPPSPPRAETAPSPAPAAPPVAAKAPHAGMSAGSKVLIAGVIVGGAGAGAVVYLKVRQSDNKAPISR